MSSTSADRTWFGQPRGLTVLFLTNMWEQFSYYGMRAILVYYMTKQLLVAQGNASLIYGTYTACAYFTPIVGGVVADRMLGKRRAIIIGGSIMAAGHFFMTFDALVYLGLITIALGNGLFLPSLPSQIDDLYKPGDPRVGWAYNVYYVGVNIGGVLGMLICGTLGEVYGWHYGFGAAGIGMVAGLCIYLYGQRLLPSQALARREVKSTHRPAGFARSTLVLLASIALSVAVFRAAYEQLGNTVALWADVGVNRHAGSFTIPMTWFQMLNPLLVMVMTPPLLAAWRRRADRGAAERPMRKMALGAALVGLSYALIAGLSAMGGAAHWLWFVLFFVVLTFGELHILPTGLGLFARLAPAGLGATTVAAWYLATFAGSLTAGVVGTLWSHTGHAGFFAILSVIALIASGMLLLLDPIERRISSPDR
jgi:POT family proton-dependent oligopeptide transporter